MVRILDTTLRDGEQTPRVNFTIEEKVHIARLLDKIGVDMIEAGDPSVSPKLFKAVCEISRLGLSAEIVAHCLAIKKNIDRAHHCGVDRVVILFPTSDIHLEHKLNMSREQALVKIREHVAYAYKLGMKVRFTPEDASRTDFDFLINACKTAIAAGADRVSFADTLGVMQPHESFEKVARLLKHIDCDVDMHCHNDFGLALANAMAGVRAGADCIHVCVNGLGERTGIPDIAETIMAYQILDDRKKYNVQHLMELSQYVEKVSGFFTAPNKPITGMNAFSHTSGVHTNGVLKNPNTYECFDPALIGRQRTIIVDKYAGKTAVRAKLLDFGIQVNDEELIQIVKEIKRVGDERKILHDADIIEIAEEITGRTSQVIPRGINALVLIAVESQVYTTNIVRKLRNYKHIDSLFEITGEHDISAYIKVHNTVELNSIVEELRTIPGIKQTSTKIVLKKHNGMAKEAEIWER